MLKRFLSSLSHCIQTIFRQFKEDQFLWVYTDNLAITQNLLNLSPVTITRLPDIGV